jgi:hypothetical protein
MNLSRVLNGGAHVPPSRYHVLQPGKVRPMVEKFTAMAKLSDKLGMPKMRITADDMKEFERIMQGYHDLVDHGKREIYKLEG